MTIEALEKRKQELQAQQTQFVANANALTGAIQNCDWMIEQLKAEAAALSAPSAV